MSENKQELAQTKAVAASEKYQAFVVVDQGSLDEAGNVLSAIKAVRKQVKEVFKPMIDTAKATLKEVKDQFDRFDSPLAVCDKNVKANMGSYKAEQDRIAREELYRIESEARKKAEDERLREAERLEAQGKKEEAEKVVAAPIVIPKPVPQPDVKTEKATFRKTWKGEVVDIGILVKAIADGNESIDFIQPNTTELNSFARDIKEEREENGIRFYFDTVVANR